MFLLTKVVTVLKLRTMPVFSIKNLMEVRYPRIKLKNPKSIKPL